MNSTAKILLVIVIILTLALAWLVYDKFEKGVQLATVSMELTTIKNEKSVIQEELNTMYDQYEDLKTNNQVLNQKLDEEREKIAETLKKLKSVKRTDYVQIKLLKDEAETLKSIMKDYIRQIDKLNTENKRLVTENTEITKNYEDEVARTETLTYLKDSLSSQVKLAKTLKAENISALPLNIRDKSTIRASKFHKVKICFTIDDNVIAKKGTRYSYIRIAGPDGIILMNKESGMFNYHGKEIAYSSKRELTYEGKKTEACVFWTSNSEQAIGKYDIDIFMDGSQIGEYNFSLK